jgi:protein subunit release factor A
LDSLFSSQDVPSTAEEWKEMNQLIEEEKAALQPQLGQLEQDLLHALLPSAQEEHRNAIVEVCFIYELIQ